MHDTSTLPAAAGAATTTTTTTARAAASAAPAVARRRVIDAPTRMFHLLFALSFAGAYLTAEGERWRALHVTLGYTLAGLLAFRLLYGLFGPRQARLSAMWRRLAGAPAWLRSVAAALRSGAPQGVAWRQGQNLGMALAVVALLVLALPLTLSGIGTYEDWGDGLGGPLAGVFAGEGLEDLHEALGEAMLAVVLGHLALIAGLSLLRRRNLARPMLSGLLDGRGPDLAPRNRAWLAALMLAAVLAFIGWQWQQSPNGLVPAQGAGSAASERSHDDD